MAVSSDRLRIATYNIYKANYFDRRSRRGGTLLQDFERLEILGNADVLAIQEAVTLQNGLDTPPWEAVQKLAPQLRGLNGSGTHSSFHGVAHGTGRLWGVALVTRAPAQFEALDLPRPAWSPWQRGAIVADLGTWIVATLHLEVWPIATYTRRQQVAAVLRAIERIRNGREVPVVLAGDFNCERWGPHHDLVRAGFRSAYSGREPTWSLGRMRLRLDHIYVRGARVVAAGVERGALGSDHWPVWAELAV